MRQRIFWSNIKWSGKGRIDHLPVDKVIKIIYPDVFGFLPIVSRTVNPVGDSIIINVESIIHIIICIICYFSCYIVAFFLFIKQYYGKYSIKAFAFQGAYGFCCITFYKCACSKNFIGSNGRVTQALQIIRSGFPFLRVIRNRYRLGHLIPVSADISLKPCLWLTMSG